MPRQYTRHRQYGHTATAGKITRFGCGTNPRYLDTYAIPANQALSWKRHHRHPNRHFAYPVPKT
jgi:hypothetical protein